MAAQNHRFAVLDGWRGIAALGVAIYHFRVYSHIAAMPGMQGAYLFVDFFFVLSGFVISYAYGDRLARWSDIGGFAVRRFGRLWPLHAATLLFLFLFEVAKSDAARHGWLHPAHPPFDPAGFYGWASLPTNLTLIQALGIHDHLSWNTPAWSICVEFWMYAVFAVLCWSGKRSLVIGGIVCILAGFAGLFMAGKGMNVSYDFGLFRGLAGFFLGHFTYRLSRSRLAPSRDWLGSCEFPALAAVALFLIFAGGDRITSVLAPLLFAPVVLVFAAERGAVSRAMRAAPIAYLGAWSYSIYMVHAPITDIIMSLAAAAERTLHIPLHSADHARTAAPSLSFGGNAYLGDATILAYLVAVIAMSALTYRWIEMPGRRFFNDLVSRPRVQPAE